MQPGNRFFGTVGMARARHRSGTVPRFVCRVDDHAVARFRFTIGHAQPMSYTAVPCCHFDLLCSMGSPSDRRFDACHLGGAVGKQKTHLVSLSIGK
jgi:hypothetical protein